MFYLTLKIYYSIVGFLCITWYLLGTVSEAAVVTQCWFCGGLSNKSYQYIDCDDPFDASRHISASCDNPPEMKWHPESNNPSEGNMSERVELEEKEKSWKCYKVIGDTPDHPLSMVRGCTESCEDIKKDLLNVFEIRVNECHLCEQNECNSFNRINPMGLIILLLIALICFCLED